MDESHKNRPKIDRSVLEQDRFLDHCVQNHVEVTIFLLAGTQFKGIIRAHDRKCLLIGGRSETKEPRMVQKSYIALIRADVQLDLFKPYRGMGTALSKMKARRPNPQLPGQTPHPGARSFAGVTSKLPRTIRPTFH